MATCKFNVGDIVRRIRFDNTWSDGRRLAVGAVCEVVKLVPFCGAYDITVKLNGVVYEGNDPDNFELVQSAVHKFKVGDKVIGNHPTRYGITKKGWIGEVQQVRPNSIYVYGKATECTMGFWVDPQYFDLYQECHEEKIVITHDGKTTTATKYCADGSKVTATAKCAPEDKFDFNVGAKLAMERLMAKIEAPVEWRVVNRTPRVGDYIRLKTNGYYEFNKPGDILKVDAVKSDSLVSVYGKNHIRDTGDPDYLWNYEKCEYEIVEKATEVTCGGFKVGDRVNYEGHNGTVVCISDLSRPTPTPIGVEFDTWHGCYHNCDGITLADGKRGTTGRCKWCELELLKHGEAPVYYNGKVVCIKADTDHWTVGKVYEIKDGVVFSDKNLMHPRVGAPYTDVNEVRHIGGDPVNGYHRINPKNEFLPIVE